MNIKQYYTIDSCLHIYYKLLIIFMSQQMYIGFWPYRNLFFSNLFSIIWFGFNGFNAFLDLLISIIMSYGSLGSIHLWRILKSLALWGLFMPLEHPKDK